MQVTTYELPAGNDQEIELRRLIVLACDYGCECQVWPAPYLGRGGLALHVYAAHLDDDDSRPDPLGWTLKSCRYLFGADLDRRAAAVALDPFTLT